jgi:hypothetical protein
MKVSLWSDGPSSQFKNRFMFRAIELFREKLSLRSVEWNFFSTSHGKGCVDGIGGSVKRMVWQLIRSRKATVKNAADFAAALASKETKTACTLIPNPIRLYEEMWQVNLANPPMVNIKKMVSNISRPQKHTFQTLFISGTWYSERSLLVCGKWSSDTLHVNTILWS